MMPIVNGPPSCSDNRSCDSNEGTPDLTRNVLAPVNIPLAENFRRILAGLAAALLLARAFGAGDPGTDTLTPLSGLIITGGWFVVLFGAALWQAWAQPARQIGGWVALGLTATSVLVVLRAAIGTSNGWLASLAAWQWLALPAAYVAVRQLAADPFDSRGLLAAVIATAAALMIANATPRISSVIGYAWPEPPADVRLTPESSDELTTAFDSSTDSRRRAWNRDLLWLTLAMPLALAFALNIRKAPRPDRLALIVPFILLLLFGASRILLDPPPLPASWKPALILASTAPAGVGPGLYSRFAARSTPGDAVAVLAEPANSYLGLTATSGLVALLALVVTIWLLVRALRDKAISPPPMPLHLVERTRWEIYIGGLLGLMGGFSLQVLDWTVSDRPPMLYLGASAAVRGVVWFLVYSCAERALSLNLFDRRIGFGLVLALVAALFYDVLQPGLAEAFWVTAALGVNLAAAPAESAWARSGLARLLPVLVATLLLVSFTFVALLPALDAASGMRRAARQMPNFAAKLRAIERAEGVPAKAAARSEAARFIRRSVVQPLLDGMSAESRDPASTAIVDPLLNEPGLMPRDAAPALVASPWCIAAWEQGAEGNFDKLGIVCAMLGQKFDAANANGFIAEFTARLRFAAATATKRDEQFDRCEKLIAEILQRDPALEARLRFRIAAAYFAAGNTKLGLDETATAHDLDARAPGPRFRLSDAERSQVHLWMKSPIP